VGDIERFFCYFDAGSRASSGRFVTMFFQTCDSVVDTVFYHLICEPSVMKFEFVIRLLAVLVLLVVPFSFGCGAATGTTETSDVVEADPDVEVEEAEPLPGC